VSTKAKFHLYRLFWLGAFATIVAVSAPTFGRPKSAVALEDFGRDGSVNSTLDQTLGEEKCAERITTWLEGLPPGRAILLVADANNNRAGVTADLIPYLAWPRPVIVSYDPQKAGREFAGARGRYCAVGFCYFMPPQGAPMSKSFGPALSFVAFDSQ